MPGAPVEEHYLDHAATTPICAEAIEAWVAASRALAARPGNPASLHAGGRAARRILEESREKVAHLLGAHRPEVVFTSGATEADALGVAGAARASRRRDASRSRVLVGGTEHDAVLEQQVVLASEGFTFSQLPIGPDGVCLVGDDAGGLGDEGGAAVALASLGMVCSELGTIQPVSEMVAALAGDPGAVVHTDATQAVTSMDVDFHDLGVDLMSIGGHKFGAPVGVGALLVRRGTTVVSDRPGGGHEGGIRSGTPDVAGAAALAAGLEVSVVERSVQQERARELREHLLSGVARLAFGGSVVVPTVPQELAVPSIIHLSLPTRHPEVLLLEMDRAGVHVSAGSACHAGVTRPSAVLLRMGRSEEEALGVLRVSTGVGTSKADIDAFLAALPQALAAAQRLDAMDRPRTRDRASLTEAR